jgi:hypothetical protein
MLRSRENPQYATRYAQCSSQSSTNVMFSIFCPTLGRTPSIGDTRVVHHVQDPMSYKSVDPAIQATSKLEGKCFVSVALLWFVSINHPRRFVRSFLRCLLIGLKSNDRPPSQRYLAVYGFSCSDTGQLVPHRRCICSSLCFRILLPSAA